MHRTRTVRTAPETTQSRVDLRCQSHFQPVLLFLITMIWLIDNNYTAQRVNNQCQLTRYLTRAGLPVDPVAAPLLSTVRSYVPCRARRSHRLVGTSADLSLCQPAVSMIRMLRDERAGMQLSIACRAWPVSSSHSTREPSSAARSYQPPVFPAAACRALFSCAQLVSAVA